VPFVAAEAGQVRRVRQHLRCGRADAPSARREDGADRPVDCLRESGVCRVCQSVTPCTLCLCLCCARVQMGDGFAMEASAYSGLGGLAVLFLFGVLSFLGECGLLIANFVMWGTTDSAGRAACPQIAPFVLAVGIVTIAAVALQFVTAVCLWSGGNLRHLGRCMLVLSVTVTAALILSFIVGVRAVHSAAGAQAQQPQQLT
jgi:hypothetical protein